MTMAMDAPASGYPVTLDIAYPEKLSRWLIFFRVFFLIPLVIAYYALSPFILLLYVVPWFVVLNDGAFPELLIKPAIWYQRISIRTSAYFNFLTDRMPLSEASPVSLEIRVPARISRLTAFLRLFMLVPHIIVLMLLGLAMSVTTFIAWWAILITGKYPRGLFDFAVGVSRWNTRVGVYAALLTDTYPSFGLSD